MAYVAVIVLPGDSIRIACLNFALLTDAKLIFSFAKIKVYVFFHKISMY